MKFAIESCHEETDVVCFAVDSMGVMIALIIHNKVYYEVDLGDVSWRKVTVSGDTVLSTKTGRILVGPGDIELCAGANYLFGRYQNHRRNRFISKLKWSLGKCFILKTGMILRIFFAGQITT